VKKPKYLPDLENVKDKSSITEESKQESLGKLLNSMSISNQRVLNTVKATCDDYFTSVGSSISASKDNA